MSPCFAKVLLRVLLRCDRFAPRLAREAVGGVPAIQPVRDDALLVTTELVSNAVLHAGCDPRQEIEVVAELVGQAVRITVADVARSDSTPRVCDARMQVREGSSCVWFRRSAAAGVPSDAITD